MKVRFSRWEQIIFKSLVKMKLFSLVKLFGIIILLSSENLVVIFISLILLVFNSEKFSELFSENN